MCYEFNLIITETMQIARVEEEERRFHRPQSAPQNSGSNNEDSEDN